MPSSWRTDSASVSPSEVMIDPRWMYAWRMIVWLLDGMLWYSSALMIWI